MSIQDDIFDVMAALKGRPQAKSFERVLARFQEAETNEQNYEKVLKAIGQGIKARKWIEEEFGE